MYVLGYPSDHPRYLNSEKYHEAGFDSFITSKVFLRLASRLNAPPSAKLEPGAETTAAPRTSENEQAAFAETPSAKKRRKLIEEDAPAKPAASTTRFSHANLYDALPDESAETPTAASTPTKSLPEDRNTTNATPIQPLDSAKISELLPAWDTDFWQRYSNKLRVYGTQEEECDLTQKRKPVTATEAVEDEKKEEDEGGVQLERRPSLLSTLGDSLQALLFSKK
jgi:poly(A)-specific ribonuclease